MLRHRASSFMHLVGTSTDPVVGHSALLQSFNHRSKTAQSDGPEQLARSAGVRNTDRIREGSHSLFGENF